MANFDEIKNKVLSSIGKAADASKGIAGKATETGKDLASKAAEKAKAGTRMAKLAIDIANEKENMKKAYIEIGKLYYDTHKEDPEGFFIQLFEEVNLAKGNVEAMEAEMAELKGGKAEDDVVVEFEEVVAEEEAAAEPEIVIEEAEEPTEE